MPVFAAKVPENQADPAEHRPTLSWNLHQRRLSITDLRFHRVL
jgi:hypothetical protein